MNISSKSCSIALAVSFIISSSIFCAQGAQQIVTIDPKQPATSQFLVNYLALLRSQGYCELGNPGITAEQYRELYKNFDSFIQMHEAKFFSENLSAREKEFLAQENQKSRYCFPLPYFTHHQGNKVDFQYKPEHIAHLLRVAEQGEQLTNEVTTMEVPHTSVPESVKKFFNNVKNIDTKSREAFTEIINSLDKKHPGIKKAFYGNHKDLTIITKVVRYDTADEWGTGPHFDRSGLSLLWHSNDGEDDHLRIATPATSGLPHTAENMKKPDRIFANDNAITSAILLPGLALGQAGFNIKPTLHAVAPVKQKQRYAVISFLLIPDITMTDTPAPQPPVDPKPFPWTINPHPPYPRPISYVDSFPPRQS